jgi:L-2-hydroxyglutarate oxidase LhgO
MDEIDCIVAGAGVIGLAIARRLAQAGREVIVVEAAEGIGTVTSARNSEVIHAGIYYKPGSLRALLCRPGRDMLYAYCDARGIPHRRCGKLIVAADASETDALTRTAALARENGVEDLVLLSGDEARAMESALACVAALHSPSTGIVDSHSYMLALRGDAEEAGASFAFHAPLLRAHAEDGRIVLEVGGAEPMQIACRTLINAAGLNAPNLARNIEGMPKDKVPKAYFAKGSYFSCATHAPFSRLIYPAPGHGNHLGIHLTLDLAGQPRFGPDIEWLPIENAEDINYTVDPKRGERFYAAIRRYWPQLPDGALIPAYSGVRPKIVPPEIAAQDWVFQGPDEHGVAGLINLFGIESPGLTSSLAIADHVGDMVAANEPN